MRIESELFLGSLKGRLAPLLKPDREQLTRFHSRNRESGIGNHLYSIITIGLPDLPLDERRLMLMLVVVLGVGCRSVTSRCYSFLFRNQPSSMAFRLEIAGRDLVQDFGYWRFEVPIYNTIKHPR